MSDTGLIVPALCALAFGLALPSPARALENECSPHVAAIVHNAYPDARLIEDAVFSVDGATIVLPDDAPIGYDSDAMVCRHWPANPQYLLVAVPLIEDRTDEQTQGDLDLLVLDSETLAVLGRTRLLSMMDEDAIRVRQLRFDTARYKLAPGRTAFGIRLAQHGSSRVNPFSLTTLWLYEFDGENLIPILDNIVVERSGGEWDGNCAGAFSDVKRTLAMGSQSHNGVADIVVTTTETISTAQLGQAGCEQTAVAAAPTTDQLVFEGVAYGVPEDLTRGW